eukprot:s4357_g1.t1
MIAADALQSKICKFGVVSAPCKTKVANVTPKRTARLFSNWPQVRLQLCAEDHFRDGHPTSLACTSQGCVEEWTCPATPAQPCCWERKQPKGRISIQLQGLVGLDVLGTYVRVQMGQQSYCTETASEDSSWILGLLLAMMMVM